MVRKGNADALLVANVAWDVEHVREWIAKLLKQRKQDNPAVRTHVGTVEI